MGETGKLPYWICPCAPPPADPIPSGAGTVDRAWQEYYSPVDIRRSSYGFNDWLFGGPPALPQNFFVKETQIIQPLRTPVVADSRIDGAVYPTASNSPPTDLYGAFPVSAEMAAFCIPRHGKRPVPVPRNWPISQPMPGAVNVVFFDGHAEPIKLDDLWQLYWHVGYVPPAKRPGL
jgi:prepilin-type processing-associated H-X9-DG protein